MIRRFAILILAAASMVAAATAPEFAGTWVFNPAKSKDVGMMAAAKVTSTITQTTKELLVQDTSIFDGEKSTHETRYDLTGATVANEAPMGDKAHTTSRWSGGKLITTWETDGAIAGTKVVRTETRYLSADGKTMYYESTRGDKDPMVIVFDRK